jgi:hypothetical protein
MSGIDAGAIVSRTSPGLNDSAFSVNITTRSYHEMISRAILRSTGFALCHVPGISDALECQQFRFLIAYFSHSSGDACLMCCDHLSSGRNSFRLPVHNNYMKIVVSNRLHNRKPTIIVTSTNGHQPHGRFI